MFLILRALLWFCRLYGITFGGLAFEGTRNRWTIKCSKFWKYYGYIVIIIILSIEVFILYMIKLQFNQLHVPLVFKLVYVFQNVSTSVMEIILCIYLNTRCYQVIKLVTIMSKHNYSFKFTSVKTLIIIIIIYLLYIICLWIIMIRALITIPPSLYIFGLIRFNYANFLLWILPSIVWIISIYTHDLLDIVGNDLASYAKNAPSK